MCAGVAFESLAALRRAAHFFGAVVPVPAGFLVVVPVPVVGFVPAAPVDPPDTPAAPLAPEVLDVPPAPPAPAAPLAPVLPLWPVAEPLPVEP